MYYSPSRNGVYDHPENYPDWPSDAREISDDLYAACYLNCPSDKTVVAGDDGLPMLADQPRPSNEWLESEARLHRDILMRQVYDAGVFKLQRELRLSSSDKAAGINSKIAALDAYAVSLLNISQQPGFPAIIDWPEQPNL